MKESPDLIFLYGPPGSGKTTIGQLLAQSLGLPFWDIDTEIESACGMTITEIFSRQGEPVFREHEHKILVDILQNDRGVIALGGGALLDPHNRAIVEKKGRVICLYAPFAILLARVMQAANQRPLLGSLQVDVDGIREKLDSLLERRAGHYASFPYQLDTGDLSPENVAWQAQILLGYFRVQGIDHEYTVLIRQGLLDQAGKACETVGLQGPIALVSDQNVVQLYGSQVTKILQESHYLVKQVVLQPGEESKTSSTLVKLWSNLIDMGLERGSSVIALGGGVINDLAGFAAATLLRGIAWAALPTSLLAMCDASIGGKTGIDLPQGKNLVGAFHSPSLVLADTETLASLPIQELRNGMAEVIKAGIIGDAVLFGLCEQGWATVKNRWPEIVSRAAAVKIQIVQEDPFEKSRRAALNLGHTLGHAMEWASDYRLKHGESVAIGMTYAARLASKLGLAEPALEERIAAVLRQFDLPTQIPTYLSTQKLLTGLSVDKKRAAGKIRFTLPIRVGEVQHGLTVEEKSICELF